MLWEMKTLALIFGILSIQIIFGQCEEDETTINYEDCIQELNVDPDLVSKNIKPDGSANEGVSSINDVVVCYYKKEQILKDDDTLDLNNLKLHLVNAYNFVNMKFDNPEEVVTNAINFCQNVQGSDLGDTLIKGYNCRINYFKEQKNKLSN